MAELAARGLAREEIDPRNSQRFYRVSAEGYRILSDVMRRNGQRSKAWREEQRSASASEHGTASSAS